MREATMEAVEVETETVVPVVTVPLRQSEETEEITQEVLAMVQVARTEMLEPQERTAVAVVVVETLLREEREAQEQNGMVLMDREADPVETDISTPTQHMRRSTEEAVEVVVLFQATMETAVMVLMV
jgi:hypothetical protein